MNTVKNHYDRHLADIYSWTAGGFEDGTERNRDFFSQLEIRKSSDGLAIDLGAGSGFQAIPLAELGFSVVAVDFNSSLLAELRENAGSFSVLTIENDILDFCRNFEQKANVIVCMGDTLTHLESISSVQELLQKTAHLLEKNGIIILTFRDYVSTALRGEQRFIPVRSDESKILTCFLEYHENFVEVFDLLYRKIDEQWKLKVSSYQKLRLEKDWVEHQLKENNLIITFSKQLNGMIQIVAQKI